MSTVPANGASSVGTTPTKIGVAQTTRKGLVVMNLGSGDLYIGDANVTTANGIKLAAGASIPLGDFAGQLYGIATAGTLDVRWIGLS